MPEPAPPLDLDAIEARATAALPAPWEMVDDATITAGDDDGSPVLACCWWGDPEDAEFIAHAREDIPALVARVRALEAEVARLQARRVKHRGCYIRDCTRPVTARDADGLLFCAHHAYADCTPL